jgi:predicted MPP superfamily phosphohydrolase
MEKIKIIENRKINYEYIYHISDIHIENSLSRFEEYKLIYKKIEKVIKQKDVNKSLICITGDIIDFKNNITINGIEQLRYCLNFFANICKVILIAGNHDSNINDSSCIDLIDFIVNMNSKNNIYYLKQSGLYKFNNIIFSVASIYDRKIINVSNIAKRNEKYILLQNKIFNILKNKIFTR